MIISGIYQLLIRLSRSQKIQIGRLGRIHFQKGLYIYTGSARTNLFQRLRRHFGKEKLLFWHIDYLLQHAGIVAYHYDRYAPGLECRKNQATHRVLPDSQFVPHFGSSDCKCRSHLIFVRPQ